MSSQSEPSSPSPNEQGVQQGSGDGKADIAKTKARLALLGEIAAFLVGGAMLLAPLLLPGHRGWQDGRPGAHSVWLGDLADPPRLSREDLLSLTRSAAQPILDRSAKGAALPEALRSDAAPRIVFLSVSDARSRARVFRGTGKGLAAALAKAQDEFLQHTDAGFEAKWVKLDVVQEAIPISPEAWGQPLAHPRSLYGLASARGTSGQDAVAFLPEEVVAYVLINATQQLQPRNIATILRSRGGKAEAPAMKYRFSTVSAFTDGREVVQLYRGHRLAEDPTPQKLLAAARLAGKYLTASVARDGRFDYLYYPTADAINPHKYNILRHAGTIYAMLELYEADGGADLLAAAERAIDFLLRSIAPAPAPGQAAEAGETLCVVEEGAAKLGGNALAILALAKHAQVTGDRKLMPVITGLARWVRAIQAKDGEFLIHKLDFPATQPAESEAPDEPADGEAPVGSAVRTTPLTRPAAIPFRSSYYPGEAAFALARLHGLDPQGPWLDCARRAVLFLIRSDHDTEPVHDHWLLYALNEVHRHEGDPRLLAHAARIAQAIVAKQRTRADRREHADWVGSFYTPPRSTPTATRMEGLAAAYLLIQRARRQAGGASGGASQPVDPARKDPLAGEILQAIRRGVAFQLQCQYLPESLLYVRDPRRALGGIRGALDSHTVRIDYVQHTLSSLLLLRRILLEQAHGQP